MCASLVVVRLRTCSLWECFLRVRARDRCAYELAFVAGVLSGRSSGACMLQRGEK